MTRHILCLALLAAAPAAGQSTFSPAVTIGLAAASFMAAPVTTRPNSAPIEDRTAMRTAPTCLTWIALAATAAPAAVAQTIRADQPLAVSGTLAYNLLFLNAPPETTRRGLAARFSGRLAVRVGGPTYVGLGVGSWARATRAGCTKLGICGNAVEDWSEAVVYQAYLQHAPVLRWPVWIRGGAGMANTSTLAPGGGVIRLADRWRAAVSAGAGADVRMSGHFFFSPSFDFTLLPSVESSGLELRHGVALGLGFTIR